MSTGDSTMTKPVRLQLLRAAGFRLQDVSRAANGLAAVVCRRPTRWGNPYVIGGPVDMAQVRKWGWRFRPGSETHHCADAAEAVRRFKHCLIGDEAIHDTVRHALGGKNLACTCDLDAPCHVDPLLSLANSTPEEIHEIHRRIDEDVIAISDSIMKGAA